MTMFHVLGAASANNMDRVAATLVAGLEIEFGRGAGEALAQRFLEAEESDFLWDARLSERWLGVYPARDDEDRELDRVAILGRLDGRWFVAVSIVDGDGNVQGLMGRRSFGSERQAREAFVATY
ncbi:hypothetical protein [Sphingomonas sp. 22176]|uniref:hypothetical protein n=1 Tax=Sphingomonas sp. 22176 TaxID=3453884 RepID=UPI003F83423F